ncbi:hypothetical protein SAMN05216326_10679 [Nitrosomonas marina]|uniref:Uncharacterized protein n=1 Tax=Nitrosomonas marina TaxID=917 RepID=A0A1I0A815_9PROT|nr:hypothetical protein SAMN05216326_10679 [Nitrosomonas marina]
MLNLLISMDHSLPELRGHKATPKYRHVRADTNILKYNSISKTTYYPVPPPRIKCSSSRNLIKINFSMIEL